MHILKVRIFHKYLFGQINSKTHKSSTKSLEIYILSTHLLTSRKKKKVIYLNAKI